MKKIIAGLAGAALLVPASATTAHAGPGDNYPGNIETSVDVSLNKTKVKKGVFVKGTIDFTVASNSDPCEGVFRAKLYKANGKVADSQTIPAIDGSSVKLKATLRGKNFFKIRFVPEDFNPCKGSHDEVVLKVRKR